MSNGMYENTQRVPPPPVRIRTKFYSSANVENSDSMMALDRSMKKNNGDENKSLEKKMANLTTSDVPDAGETGNGDKPVPNVKQPKVVVSKEKPSLSAAGKKPSSSRCLSNLAKIHEDETNDDLFSKPNMKIESNLKNLFVPFNNNNNNNSGSSNSSRRGFKIFPRSLSNAYNSRGQRTMVLEVKTDPSTCCVHRKSASKNGGKNNSRRCVTSQYVALGDGNWSLQSPSNFQALLTGSWTSIGKSTVFG